MEMNWQNLEVSKIETSYRNDCSQLLYKIAVLKISENFQENNHDEILFL